MRFSAVTIPLLALVLQTLSSPVDQSPLKSRTRPPTKYESTVLARRLLSLSTTGYLSTTYPSAQNMTHDPSYHYTPPAVASVPIALPEYVADCESQGDPTLIMLDISTSARNARHGANVSLSLDWWTGYEHATGHKPRTEAGLPRLALMGWIEKIDRQEAKAAGLPECFFENHHDAKWWEPGSEDSHEGWWGRLRVEAVYWVGGFGGQAWIGWFDVDEYKAVGGKEISAARLPGEETGDLLLEEEL